ncbi:hypothetical protein [Streptomyces sp. URMC 125]
MQLLRQRECALLVQQPVVGIRRKLPAHFGREDGGHPAFTIPSPGAARHR